MSFENFDLFAYLDSRGIEYRESGKNISKNFVGICCPFCDDSSFHMGIHKQSKTISCWVCSTRGTILKLIQEIEKVPPSKAFHIANEFQDQNYSYLDNNEQFQPKDSIELPKGCTKEFAGIFTNYLLKRNFNPEELIKTYDLYAGEKLSLFQFRVIVPVYFKRELVTYLGRDITNKSPLKYLNCPIEESKIPIKNCLYNLDSVKDSAIIVEGVTDVWRIGQGCIATFGIQYTKKQISLLIGLKKAFVLFDNDAIARAEKLANDLSCFVDSVEVLELDKGDPADMSPIDALKLRSYLGF